MAQNYQISSRGENSLHYMSVYTACEGKALKTLGLSFVAAINTHSPGTKLHLHIINPLPNTNDRLIQIKKAATSLSLSFTLSYCKPSDTLARHIAQHFLIVLRHAYYDVLYLDINLIVKKSLFAFLRHYHDTPLTYQLDSIRAFLPNILWCRPIKPVTKCLKALGTEPFTQLLSASRYQPNKVDNTLIDSVIDRTSRCKHTLTTSFFLPKSIVIICRRIDLPFDKDIIPTRQRAICNLHTDTRQYWERFPLLLKVAYEKLGIAVDLICLPHGQITPAFVRSLNYQMIYLPHKSQYQIQDPRVYFYMQDIYPWFFTIDQSGWGPTHSKRGAEDYLSYGMSPYLDKFISSIKQNKTTKYYQTGKRLPQFDVFFPLQVPHDESIIYGTTFPFNDIVKAVCDWAQFAKIHVVFKAHPKAHHLIPPCLKRKLPYIKLIYDGHIHDLIAQASIVFVANSSVGLEALLFNKPIVSFARSIYDQLTFKSDLNLNAIQHAYRQAKNHPYPPYQINQWLSWYFFETGLKLNESHITFNLPHQKSITVQNQFIDEIKEDIKCVDNNIPSHLFPKLTRWSLRSRVKLYQALFQYACLNTRGYFQANNS